MPDIMTEADLAELRALEAAATPGPWTDDAAGYWADMPRIYGDGFLIAVVGNAQPERGDHWDADAKFIAAARNAVPRLLAMIDAERAESARLRGFVDFVARIANNDALNFEEKGIIIATHPTVRSALKGGDDA